jgi:hypothetical protein
MEFISQLDNQIIAIIIGIFQIIFIVVKYHDISQSPSILVKIIQGIAFIVVGWTLYGILWGLLAFSMNFSPLMVLNPLPFIVLSGFTVIGTIIAKTPIIGGFIGGGVPLATLSLFFISSNPQLQATASPFAWFGVFMIIGGLLGAIIGPATIEIIQAVKLQTLIRCIQSKVKKPQENDFSISFDVFLSHNSKDKITVRQLAQALQARGLRVWLDEKELTPGRPWQEELEKIIQTVRTAAVLVGKDGLGPWEIPEMRACLLEFVDRHLPVIPVLLPDAPTKPELPLFLRAFTWVDLRGGLTEDNFNRLVWGITGSKPTL